MSKNRNIISYLDNRYMEQQTAIKEVCKELNLVAFYPNYHADKRDCNTVIVYTKNDDRVCSFENTDINGLFDLNYMNRGKLKLGIESMLGPENTIKEIIISGSHAKKVIKAYIEECLAKYNNEVN